MSRGWHLSGIFDRARELYPGSAAVVCGATRLNYEELWEEAVRFSAGLEEAGITATDRVAILHRNCHRFLIAALGCASTGRPLVPLNVRLDPRTLGRILDDSAAAILLTEPCFEKLSLAAAQGAKAEIPVRMVGDVEGTPPREWPAPPWQEMAQLYYTSGTTGEPRGVVLSHGNIASHALMTVAELELSESDSWAHIAPMFHLADAWAVLAITWVGGTHVMFPDFEPGHVLRGLVSEEVTLTNLVPTMLNRMVCHPLSAELDFPSLRAILSGGAPIAPSLVRRVMETFATSYVQTYGLTETSPFLTFSFPKGGMSDWSEERIFQVRARTGRPALGVSLRVVDDGGALVPRDDLAVGEIQVRAPWVTGGYLNRPEETAAAFVDGWFCTGDLATWDEEGYVNIVDRKKDMVISGGEKVFSVEVEHALSAHPDVHECAVVGLPDPDWGERVVAVAVISEGGSGSSSELRAFLKENLASFKVPKEILFWDELPKTGSGKIRKAAIRLGLTQRDGEDEK